MFVGTWELVRWRGWVVFAIVLHVGSVVELDFGVWLRVLPGVWCCGVWLPSVLGVCWWVSGFGFDGLASVLGSRG